MCAARKESGDRLPFSRSHLRPLIFHSPALEHSANLGRCHEANEGTGQSLGFHGMIVAPRAPVPVYGFSRGLLREQQKMQIQQKHSLEDQGSSQPSRSAAGFGDRGSQS